MSDKSYSELEFLNETAAKVMQEFADELGCRPDNEIILQDIDDLKSKVAALEQKNAELTRWREEYQAKLNAEHVRVGAQYQSRITELEQQLAAERARVVKLPKELHDIGNNIRAQDNRITDQPMFVVFEKREIIGSDEHSPSRVVWTREGEEVSELRSKRLEALHHDGRDTRGYDRYAMQEIDVFVTACFTEQGCKDFLRRDGHNHRLPYIYACGSYRNHEYQAVRNFLAGIPVEGE
ncbi:hypothetical protein F6Q07_20080 [Pectobacterium parmentieri]|nr:hypothetical protein [Pectobacterium parmentieri]